MSKGARKQPTPEAIIRGLPRDYQPIARAARDAGWKLSQSGGGHAKLTAPDGSLVMPLPGSGRVAIGLFKRITSQLRKAGLSWE